MKKVKGIPLTLIAVVALLFGGVMAQVVSGGWIFNQTVPDAPTSGDIDYMITITELIEFVQVDVTISGTGEVGVSHTIDYTITNIAQAGQVLASGGF